MKKKAILLLWLLGASLMHTFAQEHTTYYEQRASQFEWLPAENNKIIFCGNSITDGGEWQELFNDLRVINRGISGDVSQGVLDRADAMMAIHPSKLFLLIGVNDLARGIPTTKIAENIRQFIQLFHHKSPETQVFIQSILPVNPVYQKFSTHVNKTDSIQLLNRLLQKLCTKENAVYVDLFSKFAGANQLMDPSLTNDGLHLTGKGYLLWKTILYPLVYGLNEKPSLLPAPKQLTWTKQWFSLQGNLTITADNIFSSQTTELENILSEHHLRYAKTEKNAEHQIRLKYQKIQSGYGSDEAYTLLADSLQVTVSAETEKGIFHGLQTLRQLLRDGVSIPGCAITDQPAFAWRGLMHDVGRNFQSIGQLKKQIDILAKYKMNIFHFHPTEDIAWRLESKQYPQLTKASNMLRNPGEYYTLDEMRDLIAYCRKKFITLILEIDMPGHSDAFKRAMGVGMQSDEGLAICKNIITEISKELDLPYLHIGGDEVKITLPDFLPDMAALATSLGKKVIAWDPGGNLPKGTILQMWNGQTKVKPGMPAIDSRHLYVNHHDPIDAVVSVFNHQICDVNTGDSLHLGAIACVWPDRRVSQQEDILSMNPVYPEILALAERSWVGGGWKNYQSDIGIPGTEKHKAFTEFENRLLDQQKQYFSHLPFPYVKQSDIGWKLIGPFDNQAHTDSVFSIETEMHPAMNISSNNVSVYGGTIFLRHFWSPLIGSHLPEQKENSTYYAFTKIYSDYPQKIGLWIGFYNISRSNHTPHPEKGQWDNRHSKIWVNNLEIAPPIWHYPGNTNAGLEVPLTDEGYEYRNPATVLLNKGWNTVFIKAPVASFKSNDWQSPVKWMFSCMPVNFENGIAVRPAGIHFSGN